MLFKKTLSAFALTAMLIPASAYFATEANAQQICHNGVCWDLGDIGSECCPFSDSQLKTAVVPLTNSTEQILKIQGVKFKWKDSGREDVGVIAQNVQEAYPSLVIEKNNYLSVDYQKLVAPLIESIRELNARILVLEKTKTAHH